MGAIAATFSETLPPPGHRPHLERHISENTYWINTLGFPGGASGKESTSTCQCRRHKRHRFNPWVRKIPWSRKWHPTPVFLPRKFHGQRSLVGYSPGGCKELDILSVRQDDKCFLKHDSIAHLLFTVQCKHNVYMH